MYDIGRKFDDAIWVAKSLFERGKTAGSSANLSFLHEDRIYITGSGTCFGKLSRDSFSVLDISGKRLNDVEPSKECPLHLSMYAKKSEATAVIHTHSYYAVLWSCLSHDNPDDIIPAYTPYLHMRLGTVGLVPYAPPGTQELFDAFRARLNHNNGYLLANHGPVVAGKDLFSAFYALEELEESAHIAWDFQGRNISAIPMGK